MKERENENKNESRKESRVSGRVMHQKEEHTTTEQ
jgi:hypothetical protein